MTEERKSVAFHVTGRVQGVSFRAWTQAEARQLGVSGWVRNRDDGAVEGVAAGPAEAVDRLIARLHEGPRLAQVSGVTASPADEVSARGFDVRG